MDYGAAPEDAAPAHSWLEGHDNLFGSFINNKWNKANEVRGEGGLGAGRGARRRARRGTGAKRQQHNIRLYINITDHN